MSDYSDLIARLRAAARLQRSKRQSDRLIEAADALEALQAERDAIDAMHQTQYRELGAGVVRLVCSCGARNCPTHRILHPGEPTP